MTEPDLASRRPLKTRSNALVQRLVAALLKTSITPNQISLLSIAVSFLGAFCLLHAPQSPWLYVITALCVQLRLLCNLLDGMVAVEGGRGSPVGSLYNEIPDRIADSLFLVAWGYACGFGWLGWLAALAAAITAYIRVLGGALGQVQDFRGPMAKQHRMAALTGVCLLAMLETWLRGHSAILGIGLWMLVIGTVWTCVERTRAIAGRMG
ncbi:MAG: CDP-alcohol phosphatidyltransferase family protein [Beijerinckiaceae bacterium]